MTGRNCNSCNSRVPDDAAFCPNCGGATPRQRSDASFAWPDRANSLKTHYTCSGCGAPVVAGTHFCSRCGHDVSGEQGILATAKMVAPPLPPPFSSAPAEPPSEILEPLRRATAGEYDIAGELGRGGMATVFLAHDIALDRKVAIKVMTPSQVSGARLPSRGLKWPSQSPK